MPCSVNYRNLTYIFFFIFREVVFDIVVIIIIIEDAPHFLVLVLAVVVVYMIKIGLEHQLIVAFSILYPVALEIFTSI